MDSLFSKGFKAPKCKTLLKLAIARIKLLRNKRDIQIKQLRGEIANLLQNGQEPSARIRVEHIVREQNVMAAYEILELFCELIVVRLAVIESQRQCPLDLKEAIASVIFAAPRCADLPELLEARAMFGAKYGREFVAAAAELRPSCGVNRKIIEKLSVRAPSGETKIKLLKEIAAEHNVEWDPADSEAELLKPAEDLLDGPSQFLASSVSQSASIKKETYAQEERTAAKMKVDFNKGTSESEMAPVQSAATKLSSVRPSSALPMQRNEEQFIPFVPKLPEQHPVVSTPNSANIFSNAPSAESFSHSIPQDFEMPPVEAKKGDPYFRAAPFVEVKKDDPYPRARSPVKIDYNHMVTLTPENNQQHKTASVLHGTVNLTSVTSQEGEVDSVNVALAAQAAAESAELAAAAARAAANLAKGEYSTPARDEKVAKPMDDSISGGEDDDDMVNPYSFSKEGGRYVHDIRNAVPKDNTLVTIKPVFDDNDDYFGPDVLEAKSLAEPMMGRQEISEAWRSNKSSELFSGSSKIPSGKFNFTPQCDLPAQFDDDGSYFEQEIEQEQKESSSDEPKLNLNFFSGKQIRSDVANETLDYGPPESQVVKGKSFLLNHPERPRAKPPSNLEYLDDEDKTIVGESRSTKATNPTQAYYSHYDSPPPSRMASQLNKSPADGKSIPRVLGASQSSIPSISLQPPRRSPPSVPTLIQQDSLRKDGSEGEQPSRSSSGKLSAHNVHPKLPNYDDLVVQFSALKSNRS